MEPSSKMERFAQIDFLGGMNAGMHPSAIADNQYVLLMNGRCRDKAIEAVNSPVSVYGNLPAGLLQ